MSTLTMSARNGPDGVLHLAVPFGPANSDVTVTIRTINEPRPMTFEAGFSTPAEMKRVGGVPDRPDAHPLVEPREVGAWPEGFFDRTAGALSDLDFRRHP